MSIARRRILVVSDTLALANRLLMWLTDAGYQPAVVTTFSAAKEQLRSCPDVLITELKLREYNGLHLALRAHRDGIPTAVIAGEPRYADDARAIGASYILGENVHRDDILLLIDGLLSAPAVSAAPRVNWESTTPSVDDRGSHAREWPVDAAGDELGVREPPAGLLRVH